MNILKISRTDKTTDETTSVEIDLDELSTDIIKKLIRHGATQKIADAGAGAKALAEKNNTSIVIEANAAMGTVVANLLAGNWGVERGSSATYSAIELEIIAVIRGQVKANNVDAYKDATPKVRTEMVFAAYMAAPTVTKTKLVTMAEKNIANRDIEIDLEL